MTEKYDPAEIVAKAGADPVFTRAMEAAGVDEATWARALREITRRVNAWRPGGHPKAVRDAARDFIKAAERMQEALKVYPVPAVEVAGFDVDRYAENSEESAEQFGFHSCLERRPGDGVQQVELSTLLAYLIQDARHTADLLDAGAFFPGYARQRGGATTPVRFIASIVKGQLNAIIPPEKRRAARAKQLGVHICRYFSVDIELDDFGHVAS